MPDSSLAGVCPLFCAVNELSSDREAEQVAGPTSLTVTPVALAWVGNL